MLTAQFQWARFIISTYSWHTSTSPKSNEYNWLGLEQSMFQPWIAIALVGLVGWLLSWLVDWLAGWLVGLFVGFSWHLGVPFSLHMRVGRYPMAPSSTPASAALSPCWRKIPPVFSPFFALKWSLHGFAHAMLGPKLPNRKRRKCQCKHLICEQVHYETALNNIVRGNWNRSYSWRHVLGKLCVCKLYFDWVRGARPHNAYVM